MEVTPAKKEESDNTNRVKREYEKSESGSGHESAEEPAEKRHKPAHDHRKQTGKTRKLTWDSVLLSEKPHKHEKTESANRTRW